MPQIKPLMHSVLIQLSERFAISTLLPTMFHVTLCSLLFLAQCHGEPLSTKPQPAEQRGRSVQLSHHLAGVCGGPGLLEGPAAACGYCPSFPGHRILCQRGAALLH